MHRRALWLAAWALGCVLGSAWWVAQSMAESRNAFETDARIAHRLLSQRAVQHEAVLSTLSLMQPAVDARLPAIYPQFLHMWRRTALLPWPADAALAQALTAAERRSGHDDRQADRRDHSKRAAGISLMRDYFSPGDAPTGAASSLPAVRRS